MKCAVKRCNVKINNKVDKEIIIVAHLMYINMSLLFVIRRRVFKIIIYEVSLILFNVLVTIYIHTYSLFCKNTFM